VNDLNLDFGFICLGVIFLPGGRGKSWKTFVLFKAREEVLLGPSEPPESRADKLELL